MFYMPKRQCGIVLGDGFQFKLLVEAHIRRFVVFISLSFVEENPFLRFYGVKMFECLCKHPW